MPIYEYVCLQCRKEFSLIQPVGASEKETECPHCRAGEVKRLISGFNCSTGGSRSGHYPSLGSSAGGGAFGGGT